MEERMMDEDREVKRKKTENGYVDVVDARLDENGEEVSLELPVLEMEEDDEDLVGLSPEEALRLRQEKAERAKARQAEYAKLCAEGEAFLEAGDFANAEDTFARALDYDNEATDASVGYWRAKTENFTQPDILVAEYAESSIETLEYELGVDAVERIQKEYTPVLRARYDELCAEEKPIAERVEGKKARRKSILKGRMKRAIILFACVTEAMLLCGVLTAVIGMKNFTVRENTYVAPTIILGVLTFGLFIVFIVASNKWLNVARMWRANERLESTEDGQRLVEIQDYKAIYAGLLGIDDGAKTE